MTDSSANPRGYGERSLHEDDPLMELSRIVDFRAPSGENNAWNERQSDSDRAEPDFDPLDLERELLGNFDDFPQTNGQSEIEESGHEEDQVRYHGDDRAVEQTDFAQTDMPDDRVDPEIFASDVSGPDLSGFESAEIDEPVSRFDYEDYSSARDSYENHEPLDDGHGNAGSEDRPAAADASPASYDAPQARSLEWELENLLFGDESATADNYSHQNDYSRQYETSYAPQAYSAPAGQDEVFNELTPDAFDLDSAAQEEPYPEPVDFAGAQARIGHSDYPYYSRGNFAPGSDRHEPVAPLQESVAEQVLSEDGNLSFEKDFTFDADDILASAEDDGTDGDLSGFDDIDLSDADLDFESEQELDEIETAQADDISLSDFDFFREDDLDIADDGHQEEVTVAYAHAVLPDDDERSPTDLSQFAIGRQGAGAPVPDIETLSVAENKVEQTHAFELPEVHYDTDEKNGNLDDLESEFAEVFNMVGQGEANADSSAQSDADKAFEDIFRESASTYYQPESNSGTTSAALGLGAAAAATASAYGHASGQHATSGQAGTGTQDAFYNHWAASGAQNAEGAEYGAHTALQAEDDLGDAAEAYRERPVRGRRGLLLASVAGAVVLLGGIGYHFLGGSSNEPVVIAADNQPVKMQPENPGGATVPNQDKAVYDRVAGTLPNNPEQKTLISSGEEPVDIAAANENAETAQDQSGSTEQAGSGADAPLITPREVETTIVRADGTMMQPQPVAPQPANDGAAAAPAPSDEIGAISAENTPPAPMATRPVSPEQQPMLVQAPVVPSRPADQPVNIVGNVPPRTQTQAPAPAAAQVASAASAGGYFIQIASQPSAELAQKSFANMAQKYSSVIGGRSVDIKRAEIAGKGTYYRVRVQGGSREEANALCARLKSAGGNCLVTR